MVTAWTLSSGPCGGTLYSPPTAGARLCATLARQPAHSSQVRLLCILLAHLLQRQNAPSAANALATNPQLHRDWPTSEPGLAASAPGLSHVRVCAATGPHRLRDRPTSWRVRATEPDQTRTKRCAEQGSDLRVKLRRRVDTITRRCGGRWRVHRQRARLEIGSSVAFVRRAGRHACCAHQRVEYTHAAMQSHSVRACMRACVRAGVRAGRRMCPVACWHA